MLLCCPDANSAAQLETSMTRWVTRLIVANIAVFLLTSLAPDASMLLALVPSDLLSRPWTLITYMFAHANLMHILMNMIGLYFFGPRLETRLGDRNFLALYFLSGIGGGLLSFVLAPNAAVVGASGAILGVLAGYARFWPEDRIYIWGILPVSARMMVIGLVLYSIYSGLRGSGGGVADFAHLGGLAVGWSYVMWWERRRKGAWPLNKPASIVTPLGARNRQQRWETIRLDDLHAINRAEATRILGKMHEQGEGTLTQSEREFLDRFVP
jgi:membrane associated rhomboid family serine protease